MVILLQASFILPSNFDEVAAGVLKVLNNVALLDLVFLQQMLVSFFPGSLLVGLC